MATATTATKTVTVAVTDSKGNATDYVAVICKGQSIEIRTRKKTRSVKTGDWGIRHVVGDRAERIVKWVDSLSREAKNQLGAMLDGFSGRMLEIMDPVAASVAADLIEETGGKRVWLSGLGSYAVYEPVYEEFVREFEIGDQAEYESYNLSYYGEITNITEKSVMIKEKYENKIHRVSLYKFCWRNWDFDLAQVRKSNAEWMD